MARRAGSFDERGGGVGERDDLAGQPERLDVLGELGPAFEAMLAGYDELRIREVEGRDADGS